MLNDFNCSCPVYIACGYTDLRRGIDGLATVVKSQFQMDPFQRALFLFCGRRRDRIKALYWEGDGFLLLYKRLESGSFQWPRSTEEVQALTPQQYRWLMEGLKTEQPKANKAVDRAAEGKQGSERPERNLMPESAKSIGFLACFMVSFTHGI